MVKIVADTTSSLPLDLVRKLDIPYLPQIVIFGDESYRDDTELDARTFLEKLKKSPVLPKTAAPPPALYTPIFQKLVDEGHTIIVLTPSRDVSGTFRSAEVAAADFPNADIRVVDTRLVASNLGNVVLMAHEWASQGMDPDTIIANVHEMAKRHRVFIAVDTLEFLHKGGRIGGAQMLVGSLLQVKPILQFKNGRVEPVEQQRTKRRAIARIKELIMADCPRTPESKLTVLHGGVYEEAKALAADLQNMLGIDEVPVNDLPAAILVHAGPGVLGATYFVDKS